MPNWGGGGGGSEGSLAKDQTFSGFSFVHPSLRIGVNASFGTFKEILYSYLCAASWAYTCPSSLPARRKIAKMSMAKLETVQ